MSYVKWYVGDTASPTEYGPYAFMTTHIAQILAAADANDYSPELMDALEIFIQWFWQDFLLLQDVMFALLPGQVLIHTRHENVYGAMEMGGFEAIIFDDGSIFMDGSNTAGQQPTAQQQSCNTQADFSWAYWKMFLGTVRVNPLKKIRN